MKIIEVPIFNEDGSVQVTHLINPEETKALLQFALNFLTAAGMSVQMLIRRKDDDEPDLAQMELPLND